MSEFDKPAVIEVTYNDDGSFTYEQNTQLQMQHIPVPFDHTDRNTLNKVL